MSQKDFDEVVIIVAKSFGNHKDITYSITAISQTTGNCNSSTSTILYKAGISMQKLKEIESQIPGIKWGFGLIKPWTIIEQKDAINQEMKQYDAIQNTMR